MIEFWLDGHSKVATYMQLVQQVKQALRTGLLEPGDQLPRVREVAESLAINPNTVLKAYRQLEVEGLAEGRPGVGTFVLRSLAGPSLGNQAALRRELVDWLRRAAGAGLDQEDVVALIQTTMRATFQEDIAWSAALETNGLGKRYGRTWALRDCSLQLPAGQIAALVGPNGAGKTTLLHLAVGLLRPDAGTVRVLDRAPGADREVLSRIGFVAQDAPLYSDFTAADLVTMGGQAERPLGRHAGSRPAGPAAASRSTVASTSCPVGSALRSRSRWPSPNAPTCCCSTSPLPVWIPSPVANSSRR